MWSVRSKRSFPPTQRTQHTQRNGRNAQTCGRCVSYVSCVYSLRIFLRSLRLLRTSLRALRTLRWVETPLNTLINQLNLSDFFTCISQRLLGLTFFQSTWWIIIMQKSNGMGEGLSTDHFGCGPRMRSSSFCRLRSSKCSSSTLSCSSLRRDSSTSYGDDARHVEATPAVINHMIKHFRLKLRLHDRANVEQTSSKCIQNTRANCSTSARRLLDVC